MSITPQIVKRFNTNVRGNDYVVGDIHGHFDKVRELMGAVHFNINTDRLFGYQPPSRSHHNDSAATQTVLVDAARRGNGLWHL